MSNGQVNGRPMAYFFGVMAGAAADQCIKAGLPVPRSWEGVASENVADLISQRPAVV
jgi:hypothetical protein